MSRPSIGPLDRSNLGVMHGTSLLPPNYRDASSSLGPWKQQATPIALPTQRHGAKNPYSFNNNLGNPISRKTILNTAQSTSTPHPHKRQKIDPHHTSLTTSHYFSAGNSGRKNSSSTRGVALSYDSEPEIQVLSTPTSSRKRQQRHSVPNDAEIMVLEDFSEDIGELVVRTEVDKSGDRSSPDPIALPERRPHDFDTRPGQLSRKITKDQQQEVSNRPVSPSESDDEIESFTSELPLMPGLKSPAIPPGIVEYRRRNFETSGVSASSQPNHLRGVPTLNLVDLSKHSTIASRMKRRDQIVDPALSSSGLTDSRRKRNAKVSLPLEVWYLGHVEFSREDSDSPQKLEYEARNTMLGIVTGQPPRRFAFKLDRDVESVKVTNDSGAPLRENVVIQFATTKPHNASSLKPLESEFKGRFQAGGSRHLGSLTLVFSTDKSLGWNATMYQEFVTSLGRVCEHREVLRPKAGGSLLEQVKNAADMASQQLSRPEREESGMTPPTLATRSTTPSSSSVKTKVSRPVPKPPDPEAGPPDLRRSLRQSTARRAKSPFPPSPTIAEPDDLFLVYPPGTGALNIMRSDLKRLGPEEYLNDTLIEFGLKLWLTELREKDPTLADQIHVFSSFFYKKLNKKNPEEGYQSVRKWTSKVDLFSKKYIIVPINENVHWYLAIIYEPGHMLEPPLAVQPSPSRTTRKQAKGKGKANAGAEPADSRSQVEAASTSSGQGGDSSTSSKEATRATTPSVTQDEEMEDVTAAAVRLSCSDIASVKPSSKFSARATSTAPSDLQYPTSPIRGDAMDVDGEKSLTEWPDVELHGLSEHPPLPELKPPVHLSKGIFGSKSGVSVTRFYGQSFLSKKEEKPAGEAVVVVDSEDEENDRRQEAEVDDMLVVSQTPSAIRPSQTYIFTLDSLGSKHPQAIKVLKHYLAREARDKRGFDEVRDAIGKQVHVPTQPNYWDCGIYLLHLTKVFMNNPEHHFHIITTAKGTIPAADRNTQWQDHDVPLFRGYLASRITQLAEAWRAEKAAKDGEGKKRKNEEMEPEVISSEGEVDIVDVSGEPKVKPQRQRAPARLRG